MVYCEFSGSYYEPSPWTDSICAVEQSVPEGCPIHFTTGASLISADVHADVVTTTSSVEVPSTTTDAGSTTQMFSLPIDFPCDCSRTSTSITFHQYTVDVPSAKAGDNLRIWAQTFDAPAFGVTITPAAACPAVEWPTLYDVSLACDMCPMDPPEDTPPGGTNSDGGAGGCEVGGGNPALLLVAIAVLPLLRRRR